MSEVHKILNKHLLATCLIASLGGLLFGFDTAVIAGTTGSLTSAFHLSPLALGLTVSSALWGTVLGAAFAGKMGDVAGRRTCLRALGLLYVLTALGCALAWGWYPLLCFRVLAGLAVGGSSVISPTYIAEVSPPKLRGRLVMAFQFNVVFGMLLAYISNFCLPELELSEITKSLEDAIGSKGRNVFQWRYRFPIFLAISIGMFNQLSGINAIMYYLNDIFEKAGFDKGSSDFQAVLIGITNLISVTLAMLVIDRIGRRMLLLIGSVGTTLCLFGVGTIFRLEQYQGALVWLLMGFIGFFTFSQGAVIWVYISEVFPNRVRAKGQSIGSFTHWLMNALVSAVFPIAAARWHSGPFYFFSGFTALQFIVVMLFFPETRGISLEAMEEQLHR